MSADADTITTAAEIPEDGPEEARLLTHSYDGIREYDNPMPGWWKSIFIGTIMFAGFYGLYFHLMEWGPTDHQQYRAALTDYESKKDLRDHAEAANVSEKSLAAASVDLQLVERGAQLFKTKCATCHTDDGRGLIGPNLTDLRQIHGATRMDLYSTVSKGIPGTAMLAWGEQLPQAEVVAAVAFVVTLRGKNLAGKPGEGAPVQPFTP